MSTWILLRGLTREARHWGRFPTVLAAALPGAEILTPDLPGAGRRHRERSPATVAGIMEAVRAEVQAGRHAPPYHLLGLSLGGMVALEWATRHAAEVSGSIVVNTSLRSLSPPLQRLRPIQYVRLARIAFGRPSVEQREAMVLAATSRMVPEREALLRDWSAWRRERPVALTNALRQIVAAARYRLPAMPPASPLLVLAAARDALVDPRCSARLAAAWDLPLRMHDEAGHDLPLDDPEWVAREVGAWLHRSNDAAAPSSRSRR